METCLWTIEWKPKRSTVAKQRQKSKPSPTPFNKSYENVKAHKKAFGIFNRITTHARAFYSRLGFSMSFPRFGIIRAQTQIHTNVVSKNFWQAKYMYRSVGMHKISLKNLFVHDIMAVEMHVIRNNGHFTS